MLRKQLILFGIALIVSLILYLVVDRKTPNALHWYSTWVFVGCTFLSLITALITVMTSTNSKQQVVASDSKLMLIKKRIQQIKARLAQLRNKKEPQSSLEPQTLEPQTALEPQSSLEPQTLEPQTALEPQALETLVSTYTGYSSKPNQI